MRDLVDGAYYWVRIVCDGSMGAPEVALYEVDSSGVGEWALCGSDIYECDGDHVYVMAQVENPTP